MAPHVTAGQLRAARGLLDWTRANLAELSGVSEPTILRMENGSVQPQEKSTSNIVRTFNNQGIEFLPNDGVRRNFGFVNRIQGSDALYRFFEDVYSTVKDGGDLCVSGADERLFAKFNISNDAADYHRSRMNSIKDKLKFRVLLKEGDTYFRNTTYIEYRWIRKNFFFEYPIYVYNNKIAFIKFDKDNLEILCITMPSMATAFRLQFNFMWEHSIAPRPKSDRK